MATPLPDALARATFPRPVLHVLETLGRAGRRSWIVGGAVRDLLLGRGRADFDVATPATPEEVAGLFRKVIPTGVEHGTVTVVEGGLPIEVTTFRGEGEYRDGRRPSSVTFLDDVDGDLARRDFTMNAIALDPLARELRDPFGGAADLGRRLVRAVGDPAARFGEDGLRPLRAVRFTAQLGFDLEPATRDAIRPCLEVTAKVAAERVGDEASKLLVAPHVRRGLDLLDATGLADLVLAGLAPALRPHAFGATAEVAAELPLRLAALLHGLAAASGADAARAILERLRVSNATRDDAVALVAEGCRAAGAVDAPERGADARRWLARAGLRLADAALDLRRACARALPAPREAREAEQAEARVASLVRATRAADPPLAASDLAIDGRSVMALLQCPAGPHVGAALRHLLDRVLEDPAENTRPKLEDALRTWWTARASKG
jgi:tRNA nucleotidyltransferase (CCA-adding enzyme)